MGKNGLRHVRSWCADENANAARPTSCRAARQHAVERTRAGSRVRNLDGLVDRASLGEAEALIEADGAVVLGRDFQKGAANAGLLKSLQGLDQQAGAQLPAAMLGRDAQILDRAQARVVANALDRAAIFASCRRRAS